MESFYVDKLANSGVIREINGKQYRVAQVTLEDLGLLQAVIRKTVESPMDTATRYSKSLPPDVSKELFREAIKSNQHWPPPVPSAEGINVLLNCLDGQRALLKASLGKHHELTDEDVDQLARSMTYPEFMKIAAIAISGDDQDNDPKE